MDSLTLMSNQESFFLTTTTKNGRKIFSLENVLELKKMAEENCAVLLTEAGGI